MDYSKLSDFEINKLVFERKTSLAALSYPHSADKRSCGHKDINDIYHWFDFCNNPVDAWPIITGNGISLYHDNGNWQAEMTYYAPVGAFGTDETCSKFVDDKNPLRAAMILFLMMQEAK